MKSPDATHDPDLRSWIESANDQASGFPPQHLPVCMFDAGEGPRPGAGIGDRVVDLRELADAGLFDDEVATALRQPGGLAGLMALGLESRRRFRKRLQELLTVADSGLARDQGLQERAIHRQASVKFLLPVTVGNYSDFYASLYHATNVGSMFRPDNPLLPNWKHIPIGYHGRASSIVPSGTPVRRPQGQQAPPGDVGSPSFGPSKMLDYELEVGALVGRGNRLGERVPLAEAEAHLFGVVLINDWSARDMQRWEYQPLGPFLAKSFATTISPWVVMLEALAPFRLPARPRDSSDPQPLPYLSDSGNESSGGIDLTLEVLLRTADMRSRNLPAERLSLGTFGDMYWTLAQMLTHHASNGCNLQTGDLIASGTVSGPSRTSRGCLLELTWDGEYGRPVPGNQRTPITLPSGEQRTFLLDGDELILRGWCQRDGFRTISFGECSGTILPASS